MSKSCYQGLITKGHIANHIISSFDIWKLALHSRALNNEIFLNSTEQFQAEVPTVKPEPSCL